MIEKILGNLAYIYFPKGLCSFTQKEEYLLSTEYIRLSQTLENFSVYPATSFLLEELKKHKSLENIRDTSLLSWQDRCLSFEIDYLKGDILTKICINVSLIIPYYLVYILDNEIGLDPYRWKTSPKRNKIKENMEYKSYIDVIEETIHHITNFHKFPEELMNVIVPDLTFQDITFGNFTFYNTFFLNENKLTMEHEHET